MRRTHRLILALAAALAAVPAQAALAAGPPAKAMAASACSGNQPFAPWGDTAAYTAALNGGFELGLVGWTTSGAVTTVAGNEPWSVAGAGSSALELRDAGVASGRFGCLGQTRPSIRLFARNLGARKSSLRIDLLYTSPTGVAGVATTGTLVAGAAWGVTPAIGYSIPDGSQITGVRLAVQGSGGIWQVDDVYVDPYRRV